MMVPMSNNAQSDRHLQIPPMIINDRSQSPMICVMNICWYPSDNGAKYHQWPTIMDTVIITDRPLIFACEI